MIYFDAAASYPVLPEVQQTLQCAFAELYGNSTASHPVGVAAHDEIERAREILADSIGAMNSEIVFTSGATESNNIAFKSILLDNPDFDNKRHIVTTVIEHKCILAVCRYLEETHDFDVTYVTPDKYGLITRSIIEDAIQPNTAIVSVMHANNELGTINPIADIGELCFRNGILFHSDAAQSFCKTPIDVDLLNIDVMSFSAHKIGGPKGVGAIYIRDLRKRKLSPVIHGAGQEEGLRGGTVASPLIQAFGTAIEYFPRYYKTLAEKDLKHKLLKMLTDHSIAFSVNGDFESTLPNIVSISFHHFDIGILLRDLEGIIALAQGSACSSKEIEPSHVLSAMGLSRELSNNTLRISFSHLNTEEDLNNFIYGLCRK